jgi:probable phosphoglycerate mutase
VIVVVRHGETAWSASGRHTSYTEVELTADGERQARAVGAALAEQPFTAVLCSPRRRASRTAELAGLRVSEVDGDLAEWDYGEYEGVTTPQIRATRPGWDLWTDGCPGGESPAQVSARADRVLARVRPLLDAGDVALVGHGHMSRAVAARWVEQPVAFGGRLRLSTGTVSVLGHEHERPTVDRWNAPVS